MSNNCLALISKIIDEKVMGEVLQHGITLEHMKGVDANLVFQFLLEYYNHTDTSRLTPSWTTVINRFPDIDIPRPDPTAGVLELCAEVRRDYLREKVVDGFDEIMNYYDTDPEKALQFLNSYTKDILLSHSVKNDDLTIERGIEELRQDYEMGPDCTGSIGFPREWGWLDDKGKPILDDKTGKQKHPFNDQGGILSTDMVYFYGRPGSMKSWILASIAESCHITHGLRVMIVSKELSHKQLLLRIISIMAGINYTRLKMRQLTSVEEKAFYDLCDYIAETENDPKHKDNRLLITSCRDSNWGKDGRDDLDTLLSRVELFEPDIILIDSAYLMQVGGRYAGAKHTDTQQVAYAFKALTRELGIPIVANGQANRMGDQQKGENLSEIANGDGWAQASDVVYRVVRTPVDESNKIYDLTIRLAKGRDVSHPGITLTCQMGNSIRLSREYTSQMEVQAALTAAEKINKIAEEEMIQKYIDQSPISRPRLGVDPKKIGAKPVTRGTVLNLPLRK